MAQLCFLLEYITHVALVFFAGDIPKASPCWAPRRVGSMGDELLCGPAMAAKFGERYSAKCQKRALSDDSDEESTESHLPSFPRYIVIKSEEEKQVTKLSPFVIEKQVSSIIGPGKPIKSLQNGTLLVECNNKQQAENLLKTKKFFNL